jgi:hypothetical protein
VRKYFYTFIVFLVISVSVSYSQTGGTLQGCKKWFNTAMKDFKKDYYNFTKNYCKIPFLLGQGGDAYYSYNTAENDGVLIESLESIFGCFNKKSAPKKFVFKEIITSEESLAFLSNSYEYNERDENGNKVNPKAKPPYDGLISYGEKVFTISYNCGTKHPSYNSAPVYELYVIFDKASKSYRFWAATSGF